MALTTAQLKQVKSRIEQQLSNDFEEISITKPELLAAVQAVDEWIDANASSYNQALPTAARTGLTTKQKAQLLRLVTILRWEVN